MADQQQLKLLKQGVEAWNKLGKEHRDERPALRGADLSGADLKAEEANLSGE